MDLTFLILRQKIDLPALGGWFYVIVTLVDLTSAIGLMKRRVIAEKLSYILPRWAANFVRPSYEKYHITRHEITLVLLYGSSAIFVFATLLERVVRKLTGLDVMIFYYAYPTIYNAISFLSCIVFLSAAVHALLGYYIEDNEEIKKER
ncbi:hypothetical protein [Marinibactrum halimedae]|uniref:hypothetical protein n=1 Tax=Marinibactrum halimedae TaxID=1444977 RepID=UPI001E3A9F75|nr:hypothetical protein [Marinibactrum halimedae]MCD9458483.1 hypothetical protein [Marinibactrum halimedae]